MARVRYENLSPASARASKAAQGSSRKRDTKPEAVLRKALRALDIRGYRLDAASLAGRPDIVFGTAKVAVFCDGDFWHGRDLTSRLAKLRKGHNAVYWVDKIRGNVARDRRRDIELEAAGWTVLRFWETDIVRDPTAVATKVAETVASRRSRSRKQRAR